MKNKTEEKITEIFRKNNIKILSLFGLIIFTNNELKNLLNVVYDGAKNEK